MSLRFRWLCDRQRPDRAAKRLQLQVDHQPLVYQPLDIAIPPDRATVGLVE